MITILRYTVFCPKTKTVKIKNPTTNKVYEYSHGQVVNEEGFFKDYPHIFHVIEPKGTKIAVEDFMKTMATTQPLTSEAAAAITAASLFDEDGNLEEADYTKDPSALELKEVSKGWFIVIDPNNGNRQIHPAIEGKKCRKAAAVKFISEYTY